MALSEKDILEILELFQKSGWEDLTLESGGVRLSISKSGRAAPLPRSPGGAHGSSATVERARAASGPPKPPEPAHSAPTPTAPIDPGWIAVKAPMLGTYYAASKPGAPPFVSVGQAVSADDNICIIEVMKLMNYVKAGMRGTIAHIAVSNGDLVEYDQALVYIDPA
jgi:acetyl-CoA carboxylase biotin carboxyl carrier protein